MSNFLKIIGLLLLTIFFNSTSYSKENFFNEALELFKKEKYKDARFLFERNIVFNPKDANSYLYLAKIYNQEENQRKEEYNLETTLLIQPDNEEALLMLMKIALEKSNYEKVKKLSDKFVKVCKNLCNENKDIQDSLKNKNVKIISDGGIKYSGDLAKAFAAGADAVMIGSLFAGTSETPGKLIKKNGQLFKSFRGMGSVGAMNKGSADRYFQKKQKDSSKYVPEGVEGFVKYKGEVGTIIYKLIGGLKSSMGYLGSKTIIKLRNKPQFVKITKAGFYESMVHNVDVVIKDSKY